MQSPFRGLATLAAMTLMRLSELYDRQITRRAVELLQRQGYCVILEPTG
jgi:hypothetical protein